MSGAKEAMNAIAQMKDPRRGKVINHDGVVADTVVRMMRHHWELDEEGNDGAAFRRRHKRVDYVAIFSVHKYPDGRRWLHASLSRGDKRLPTWNEMKWLRDEVIGKDAKAIIVIPPADEHVNQYEVHHIWHCLDGDVLPDFTLGTGCV